MLQMNHTWIFEIFIQIFRTNLILILFVYSAPEIKKSRDPRQAKNLDMEITSPVLNSDPRTKPAKTERRDPRTSIYEQGIIDPEEVKPKMYEETKTSTEGMKGDVDLRNMEAVSKDLDMRPSFGDTDLRTQGKLMNLNSNVLL